MEILIGLAVATVLVIGWIYGNLFACVFLTLGALAIPALGLLALSSHESVGVLLVLGGLAMLVVIWTPRYYWLKRLRAWA